MLRGSWRRFKAYGGIVLKDAIRYERALHSRGDAKWIQLCNRNEFLREAPWGVGVECLWDHSSVLHAPTLYPAWGRRLLARALQRYPIRLLPLAKGRLSEAPVVSVIIVHRGQARLPLLLHTLRSLNAQTNVAFECIVVEESDHEEIREYLPSWVRYVHRPTVRPGDLFNRSAAFNAGVSLARGDLLVLHDNDMLIPRDYLAGAVDCSAKGYEAINLKRFIFYLDAEASERLLELPQIEHSLPSFPVRRIVQNLEAGGSVIITREAFETIGGMDEKFLGWGGEDVEFWQRAQTRRVWNCGYLPMIHLWHRPQPGKTQDKQTSGMNRLKSMEQVSLHDRIQALRHGE